MTKIIMTVLSFILFSSPLYAANLPKSQMKELEKFANGRFVDLDDSHLININYVGSSTEACLGISSWTIISETPQGTADTSFGTSGTYNLGASAYDSIGELCDAIDFLSDYECTITDGKRNDDPKYMLDVTAVSGSYDANAVGGYNVLLDSGTYASDTAQHIRIGINPKEGYRVILKRCMANGNGTKKLEISGKLRRFEGIEDGVTRNDNTIVWTSEASSEGADEYYPVDSSSAPIGRWLEFGINEHVVISMNCDEIVDSDNLMWCEWIEK